MSYQASTIPIFLQQLINFYQGKMILFIMSLILICKYTAMDVDLGNVELPNNILKFGYGINYVTCKGI